MSYPQWIETNSSRQSALPATPYTPPPHHHHHHHYEFATATTLPSPRRRYTHAMHKLPPALTCSGGATTEINAMIDEHLAWQKASGARPVSRGTLLVDWDGSGEPVVSYRRMEVEVIDCEEEEEEEEEKNKEQETTMEASQEEEEHTLIPSPLRSVASLSLPSSPLHRAFASMPSSPFRSTSSFASIPASPAATEPSGKKSFERRMNIYKVLPRPPTQRESVSSVADGYTEWDEGCYYDPVCAYTGLTTRWHAEACEYHEQHVSLESVVEDRYAVHREYDAVDVEEWVERTTEKRRERNGRKKGKRREKLLGTLDKEWCGAKRVLKKMF